MNRRQFQFETLGRLAALAAVAALPWSYTRTVAAEAGVTTPRALNQRILAGLAPVILDVRSTEEFSSGHIPGAINLPVTELMGRVKELVAYKDAEIVVHCEAGPRAGMASWILKRNGFTHLVELQGHMQAWRDAGLPMAQ